MLFRVYVVKKWRLLFEQNDGLTGESAKLFNPFYMGTQALLFGIPPAYPPPELAILCAGHECVRSWPRKSLPVGKIFFRAAGMLELSPDQGLTNHAVMRGSESGNTSPCSMVPGMGECISRPQGRGRGMRFETYSVTEDAVLYWPASLPHGQGTAQFHKSGSHGNET